MTQTQRINISFIMLRVFLGGTMAIHGLQKFLNLSDTTDFFISLGLPSYLASCQSLLQPLNYLVVFL